MDFERLTANIFRIELPLSASGPLNLTVAAWLIRSPQGWALVDSGPPDESGRLVAALARATQGEGPRRVLLTHAHPDHSGALNAIYTRWQPQIVCHESEAGFVTGERDYRDLPTRNPLFWIARQLTTWPNVGLPVTRALQRGESVDDMVVIHLPGHTPGQIGFLHSPDQALICGDALMSRSGRVAPPLRLTTADVGSARASMQRMGDLDFKHLLPSHGPPIMETGREALAAYLGKRLEPEPW